MVKLGSQIKRWVTGPVALLVAVYIVGFTIGEIQNITFPGAAGFVTTLLPLVLGVGLLVGALTLIPGLKGI